MKRYLETLSDSHSDSGPPPSKRRISSPASLVGNPELINNPSLFDVTFCIPKDDPNCIEDINITTKNDESKSLDNFDNI